MIYKKMMLWVGVFMLFAMKPLYAEESVYCPPSIDCSHYPQPCVVSSSTSANHWGSAKLAKGEFKKEHYAFYSATLSSSSGLCTYYSSKDKSSTMEIKSTSALMAGEGESGDDWVKDSCVSSGNASRCPFKEK